MNQSFEPLPVEDPIELSSEASLVALHGISSARYIRDLRKQSKDVFNLVRTEEITLPEADILFDEIGAKKKVIVGSQQSYAPSWEAAPEQERATAGEVPSEVAEREFDWAERAAGEYLDRD